MSSLWHGTDRADVDQQVATDGAPVNDSNGRVNDGPTGSVLERSEFGGTGPDDQLIAHAGRDYSHHLAP